jgi:PIN domain nuclease of toxin-antitoxin system
MADAIVYATARLRQADLLTCDAQFNELPGAIVVAKSAH